MALFYLQKTQVFPMVFVPIRQAGEPAKKRELLKVLEKVAMWQARETRPCRVEPAVGGEIGSNETWGNETKETKEIGWKMETKPRKCGGNGDSGFEETNDGHDVMWILLNEQKGAQQ